jgi:hypothetical protein
VILPVRDLAKAAASRTILELRNRYQDAPWLAHGDESWETWGITAGGSVFSLNPLDQARILAVGFHRVVERLVEADIPIVFLAFPRFAENWEYLYLKLKDHLPVGTSAEQARAAHDRVADREKIRVENELRDLSAPLKVVSPHTQHPNFSDLDRIALRRELVRLWQENAKLAGELDQRTAEARDLQVLRDTLMARDDALLAQQDASAVERDALHVQQNTLTAERDALLARQDAWIAERGSLLVRLDALTAERDRMLASRSGRFAAPFRMLRRLFPRRRSARL